MDASSERIRVRRAPKRGQYDADTINQILDEALICHVGFNDHGGPFVIPTIHARIGANLYIHGSKASRLIRCAIENERTCITVTLIDGLVLARSTFHHSMNYRSVVILSRGTLIEDETEKLNALKAISDHMVPNRWDHVRKPNANELKATAVVQFDLNEASAKIRTGPPADDFDDYALPVWAGVVPMQQRFGQPSPDPKLAESVALPEHVKALL